MSFSSLNNINIYSLTVSKINHYSETCLSFAFLEIEIYAQLEDMLNMWRAPLMYSLWERTLKPPAGVKHFKMPHFTNIHFTRFHHILIVDTLWNFYYWGNILRLTIHYIQILCFQKHEDIIRHKACANNNKHHLLNSRKFSKCQG